MIDPITALVMFVAFVQWTLWAVIGTCVAVVIIAELKIKD